MIKVKPEWRDWIYLVSPEEIENYVNEKDSEKIHCMIWGWMMIWADWGKQDFLEKIKSGWRLAITIPAQMWHNLAYVCDKEVKLYLFDIGKIDKDMLIIESLV